MSMLLKFFLPKLTFIFKIFSGALLFGFTINILPFDKESKEFFEMVIYFGFPVYSFFSRKALISTNLNWILLTPIKAKDIILTNVVLNLTKITIISILMILYLLIFHRPELINLFTFEKTARGPSGAPTAAFAFLFIGMHFTLAILFALTPDYQAAQRERMDYRPPKMDIGKISQFILVGAAFVGILSSPVLLAVLFPGLILVSLVLMTLVFFPVMSTIKSLKLYHHKRLFPLIIAGSFFFYFILLFSLAMYQIGNSKTSMDILLEDRDFLGIYGLQLKPKVLSRLKQPDATAIKLRSNDIGKILTWTSKTEQNEILLSWSKQCENKQDFSCRLAAYIHEVRGDFKKSMSSVLKSCPNDLQSCYVIMVNRATNNEQKDSAESNLAKGCSGKVLDEEVVCCKCLEDYRDQKAKNNSANRPKD